MVQDLLGGERSLFRGWPPPPSEAVKQWEYTPTLLNCSPVEVKMGVTVSFTPKQQ